MNNRIREERKRLGLNQKQLAEITGLQLLAQSKYERGVTEPKASYFLALQDIGADVYYILTGKREVNSLSNEELLLLDKYRTAESKIQKKVLKLLLDNKESSATNYIGDISNSTVGDINQGNHNGK